MGYASHLIVKTFDNSFDPSTRQLAQLALTLYWAQLAGNYLWTPLFFQLKQTGLALLDIVALTGTVYALTNVSSKLPTPAPAGITPALLFAPYCAWLTYATYLNAGYWYLNYSPWARPKQD